MRRKTNKPLALGAVVLAMAAASGVRGADEKREVGARLDVDAVVTATTPPAGPHREDPVLFDVAVDDRAVHRLDVHVDAPDPKHPPEIDVEIRATGGEKASLYQYHGNVGLVDYLYFPVLDRGSYRVGVKGRPSIRFTLKLTRPKIELTDADRSGASAAIERGTALLASKKPADYRDVNDKGAAEALVMAALQADRSGKYRETIGRDYVAWLKQQSKAVGAVQSGDRPLMLLAAAHSSDKKMYTHAIATMALAESAAEVPAARELAAEGARLLVVSQLTDHRPAPWKRVDPTERAFGGWRYEPGSTDADISVTGWCLIALNACSTAGIDPPGTREAMDRGMDYVRRCQHKKGFSYRAEAGDPGSIRDAIGSLLCTLDGSGTSTVDDACDQLDRELFGGTQVERSDDYPLYYAYYATRLNYLRGGFAWEAWRVTAIRQLLKLQHADGSWPSYDAETGERYGTALSVLILRMCLNDVPDYLKQQAKGF